MDFIQQGNRNQDIIQHSIPSTDRQTNRKDKLNIETISKIFHIRKTKRLDRMIIYNTIDLQHCNIKEYRNTGITPYFAIYRYEMEISIGKPNHNPTTMMKVTELRYIYTEM